MHYGPGLVICVALAISTCSTSQSTEKGIGVAECWQIGVFSKEAPKNMDFFRDRMRGLILMVCI